MSRKLIIAIAAAATVAAASFGSSAAYARGFGGGGMGGGRSFTHVSASHAPTHIGGRSFAMVRNPGRHIPIIPIHLHLHHEHEHHHHWVFRGGRWIVDDGDEVEVGGASPVVNPTPGPCTCLTKTYTPDGQVVFSDVCTKESVSAPVDGGSPTASQVPDPTNYAGRTYKDYLAANPQARQPSDPQKD